MLKPARALGTFALVIASSVAAQNPTTLKDAYKNNFYIGTALNTDQITGDDYRGQKIIAQQFSSITPENVMKWEKIHPQPNTYDFSLTDKYVAFGEKNHMFIVGHTLVWHSQTPDWVFQDDKGNPITRDALLKRMHDHIFAVVGRYKGHIQSWDVVNEALNDDGTLRESKWKKIIGEDYLIKAYQWAHEADPAAELNYNDFSLENEPKRKGAIALIQKLQAAGIKVAVVGVQGHDDLTWPSTQLEEDTINAFAKLGVKVAITELDINVLPNASNHSADVALRLQADPKLDPYAKALPDSVQKQLAQRYADLFSIYWKHREVISRVTIWGLADSDS